jgi:hypothetical protein
MNLEGGCRVLGERQEYETDQVIPYLVSIQHVVAKINTIYNEADNGFGCGNIPMSIQIQALKAELDCIKSGISSGIRDEGGK